MKTKILIPIKIIKNKKIYYKKINEIDKLLKYKIKIEL